MTNGTGTFSAIKNILEKDTLADNDARRLLLAAILDINNKFVTWQDNNKKEKDIRDKKQDLINKKVERMWYLYGINVAILVFFATAVGRLMWSLFTGEISITYIGT